METSETVHRIISGVTARAHARGIPGTVDISSALALGLVLAGEPGLAEEVAEADDPEGFLLAQVLARPDRWPLLLELYEAASHLRDEAHAVLADGGVTKGNAESALVAALFVFAFLVHALIELSRERQRRDDSSREP